MPLKTYNNNDRQITNTTYSSIVFTNPDSKLMPSRFSITYFNKLMKVAIALRNNPNSNESYATYDTDNQIAVYVSNTKAEVLRRMILKLFDPDKTIEMHNVCIELKNGLLKISDGEEYNVDHPVISISYADNAGNVNEVLYEIKPNAYSAAYNYKDGQYSTLTFNTIEIDAVVMTLEEYYKASAYAQAAAVMESEMYKRNSQYELIRAIADKVGVPNNSGNGGNRQQNTKSFLNGGGSTSTNIPQEYQATTFDALASQFPG